MHAPRQSFCRFYLQRSMVLGVILLLLALPALFPALAEGNDVAASNGLLGRCQAIPEITARAACYDAIANAQRNPNPASPETQHLPMENQRLRDAMARRRQVTEDGDSGEGELVDRIAGLEIRPDGWIITLQNGQIWRQTIKKRYNLNGGQQIRIYPSIWGSGYRLTAEDIGGFIQVKRVR